MAELFRPVWSEIDLDAVRANVVALRAAAEPAALLAVVKADGYGHGAVPVARAALDAGAAWLGVALVEEGVRLRDAGIDAPILLLSEPPSVAAAAVVAAALTPVVYTPAGIEALAKAVVAAGREAPLPVHLKVDTGMHRVGCHVDEAVGLVEAIAQRGELQLQGICTHLAVADEPDDTYTIEQLARFDALLATLHARGARPPLVHAANSAALLEFPQARYDLVRAGIAVYGVAPAPGFTSPVRLEPALALTSARLARQAAPCRRARLVRTALRARTRRVDRNGAGRIRRRRAPQSRLGGRRSAAARSPVPDCRHGHDGPAHGRYRRRPGRGR